MSANLAYEPSTPENQYYASAENLDSAEKKRKRHRTRGGKKNKMPQQPQILYNGLSAEENAQMATYYFTA